MSLKIIKAGIFDTIQDKGRKHFRHLGINSNGPSDSYSAQLANALLGKDTGSAVIEMHFPAPVILFEKPTIICVTGANFCPRINGNDIPLNHPVFIPADSRLEFVKMISGCWSYLATLHDLDIQPWLGSWSTNTKISAGGLHGCRLKKDDRILFQYRDGFNYTGSELMRLHWQVNAPPITKNEIQFLKGNEWNWMDAEAVTNFQTGRFKISSQSDRMGTKLEGILLFTKDKRQLVSSAVCAGTIQLLPDGQLIVLMADHQTTGGYPRIAYITSTSLPALAQQQPGNFIKFKLTTLADAEEKMISREHYMEELKMTCLYNMKNFLDAHL
jgi:antagonist of KipI